MLFASQDSLLAKDYACVFVNDFSDTFKASIGGKCVRSTHTLQAHTKGEQLQH